MIGYLFTGLAKILNPCVWDIVINDTVLVVMQI